MVCCSEKEHLERRPKTINKERECLELAGELEYGETNPLRGEKMLFGDVL